MEIQEADLYQKAIEFAAKAHRNQYRKYTHEPYILHPINVAEILRGLDMSIETIVAGVLHDVVEDTDCTLDQIEKEFGKVIAEIVNGVTNVAEDKSVPRKERFWQNVQHLTKSNEQAQNVKCADIISNMKKFGEVNPDFAAQYTAEKMIVIDHLYEADPLLILRAKQAVEANMEGIRSEHMHLRFLLEKG